LLCGPPALEAARATPDPAEAGALSNPDDARLARLEEEIHALRMELQALGAQFQTFKKQFE
jgi:hypothetical protein